jgi:hypothetical protein
MKDIALFKYNYVNNYILIVYVLCFKYIYKNTAYQIKIYNNIF